MSEVLTDEEELRTDIQRACRNLQHAIEEDDPAEINYHARAALQDLVLLQEYLDQ